MIFINNELIQDAKKSLSMTANSYEAWASDAKNKEDPMRNYAKLMADSAAKLHDNLHEFQIMTGRI